MQWLLDYDVFLFDFDGLLVNTEEIHYQAYKLVCQNRGHRFDIDFPTYCSIAHYTSEGLSKMVYGHCPQLQIEEPRWEVLYGEKTENYMHLLASQAVKLMPGAHEMIEFLAKHERKRCVVTHSAKKLVDAIREHNPILNTIPLWITREDYKEAKPKPDSYLAALSRLLKPGEKAIGFEDTPRGIQALLGTEAQPVIVTTMNYPEIPDLVKRGVIHFESLTAALNHKKL